MSIFRLFETPGDAGARFYFLLQFNFISVTKTMSTKKKKKPERPIFDSIRKPTAPPGQKIGSDKPDEKVYPSRRKIKHKKLTETEE
jgi:hypothetical protein